MKNMKLKTRLIFGALGMVILVMIASSLVVSIIINKQNENTSNNQLKKSLDIIRDDLLAKQEKLILDSRQMATIDGMGGKIDFLYEFKSDKDPTMTKNAYREITNNIFNIASASNLWKAGIYDVDGDLGSFVFEKEDGVFFLGYCLYAPSLTLQTGILQPGEQMKTDSWQKMNDMPNMGIKIKGLSQKEINELWK